MAINGTNEGVYRILTELHCFFDFVDFEDDIGKYDMVILPDSIQLPSAAAKRVSAYLAGGGKILLTGESGLGPQGGEFVLPELGLKNLGAEEYSPAYAAVRPDGIFAAIPSMDYTVYERGQRIEAGANTVLARLVFPYFNRTWEHFCSHRQTPPQPDPSSSPFAVEGKNYIYITHPLFRDYALNGCKVHKDIISACLNRLLEKPLVRGDLPSTLELTLRKRGGDTVMHFLHYIPMKRCRTVEIIEDVIPLYNVAVQVRMGKKPAKVYTAPEGVPLGYTYEKDYVSCTVPEVRGHQMLVFEA
jgi:hypothetical protein